jgi:F0F1-type ATP synthase membrane subunit a
MNNLLDSLIMLSECKENICYISFFKSNHPFFYFTYTIFYHVLFLHIILYILFYIAYYWMEKYKKKHYINDNGNCIYFSYMYIADMFVEFIIDAIHLCNKRIFSFVSSFFILLFSYNCASLIPHLEDTTKDLNVCLAFAIYGFLYIQYIAICQTGVSYLHHWGVVLLRPIESSRTIIYYLSLFVAILVNGVATIVMFPFAILEKLSLLFSLTFRLFGNIFGGSIVIKLLHKVQSAALLYYFGTTIFGIQLLVLFYFGLFEGAIQAFVFTLVLLNNIGTLINKDK